MKMFTKFMAYMGYEKINKEILFTVSTFEFVNLVKSRGKFTTDQPGIEEFDALLNKLAVKFGYEDWLVAYNAINHPSYAMETSKLLDMSTVKRPNGYEVEMLELAVPKVK